MPDLVAAFAGAGAVRQGRELVIKGVRVAPFGNAHQKCEPPSTKYSMTPLPTLTA